MRFIDCHLEIFLVNSALVGLWFTSRVCAQLARANKQRYWLASHLSTIHSSAVSSSASHMNTCCSERWSFDRFILLIFVYVSWLALGCACVCVLNYIFRRVLACRLRPLRVGVSHSHLAAAFRHENYESPFSGHTYGMWKCNTQMVDCQGVYPFVLLWGSYS